MSGRRPEARPGRPAAPRLAVPHLAVLPVVLLLALAVSACAVPLTYPPGPRVGKPHFLYDWFVAADGIRLPTRTWAPKDAPPRAVVVALHGFNDYSNFFAAPGAYLAGHGIVSHAYDQRGFGGAPDRGTWAGIDGYARDLTDFVAVVRRRHPGLPVYVLGESFGGAVAMVAATGANPPDADGIILAAPAVWGRSAMTWYERSALWVMSHTLPTVALSARGLNIVPSDNRDMLIALGRDPKVIKETRVETIAGLADMMDAALASAGRFEAPALILYGGRDEIIPGRPTLEMVRHLPADARGRQRFALYENGYHMLLRDLQAKTAWRDIAAWIADPRAALPSAADSHARKALADGLARAR